MLLQIIAILHEFDEARIIVVNYDRLYPRTFEDAMIEIIRETIVVIDDQNPAPVVHAIVTLRMIQREERTALSINHQ
jgi:hypothetical protein